LKFGSYYGVRYDTVSAAASTILDAIVAANAMATTLNCSAPACPVVARGRSTTPL